MVTINTLPVFFIHKKMKILSSNAYIINQYHILSMSIYDIPDDVYRIIFAYLNDNDISRTVMAHVDKKFYELVSKYSILNNLPRRFKIEHVSLYGYLRVLKWALKNRYKFNKKVCSNAAKNNHIELLRYARKNECEWDIMTSYYLTVNGDLDNLKWAIEEGCKYNGKWGNIFSVCRAAAEHGHLDILKWLKENDPLWDIFSYNTHIIAGAAALGGKIEIIKWLRDSNNLKYLLRNDVLFKGAVKGNRLDVIIWSKENGYINDEDICPYTVGELGQINILRWMIDNNYLKENIDLSSLYARTIHCGNIEMIKFVRSLLTDTDVNNCNTSMSQHVIIGNAVDTNNLEIINYVCKNGCKITTNTSLYERAASLHCMYFDPDMFSRNEVRCNIDILKWLKDNDYSKPIYDNGSICNIIAKKGQLDVLKWLKENNFVINRHICKYAIDSGNIDVLSWLVQIGCETNGMFYRAIQYGDIIILKWIKRNLLLQIDNSSCSIAAIHNNVTILKWLRKNGFTWNIKTTLTSAKNSSLDAFRYAIKNGCPYDIVKCYNAAEKNNHNHILKWIKQNFSLNLKGTN